ncbi:MAG: FkbM family methyltransferase [Candidatus Omnitrophica bacterium]|nr:FkbM family methyltransferase [Candidatus Omnitrophota bacterium]
MLNFIENLLILFFACKGLKNKIAFTFYLFLNLINRLKIVNVGNKDFKIILNDATFWIGLSSGELGAYIEIFVRKIYEQIPDFKAKSGDVVIDIGSSIGLFAIRQASRVGRVGKVWAFEPNPVVFNRLLRNFNENCITNAIAVQKAVTSKTGKIKFGFNRGVTPESKLIHSEELHNKEMNVVLDVECITLDDFTIKNNIEKINLLKIDAEGEEYEVLRGHWKEL